MSDSKKILIGVFLFLFACGGLLAINGNFAGAFTYWFFLAVVFAGLWFLFGGKDTASVPPLPRNWRRIIIGVALAGLIAAALMVATIYVQEHEATRQRKIESEKREQAKKIEEEASKHRIAQSEIDLVDLRFEWNGSDWDWRAGRTFGEKYRLTGKVRNRSAYTLDSVTLIVKVRENSGDFEGEEKGQIRVEVPPGQARQADATILFGQGAPSQNYTWSYAITEIRGSEGKPSPKP